MKQFSRFLIALSLLISCRIAAQPVLGMTTFFTNTTTVLHSNTSCVITKTTTLSGWLFSVSSTSNCGFNWTSTTGGDGRIQYLVGFGTLTQGTFGSDDGSEVDLQSLTWGVSTSSWTSKPMQFVGYKNGMPVPGATLNVTTPSGTGILNTLVVNFNSPFDDVDEVRLAPVGTATCNSILFFEDITVGVAVPSCPTPTLNLTGQNNVLCNGGSTGSATVSASGGPPFTYTWSPSGGNAATATGLSAGVYTCVVTNSCGSTASRTVNITQPSAVVGSTAVTMPLCNGANGSATITLSGGTTPYTYTWSSGPTSSVEPTLLAGTYTVRGTDANGCSVTRSVTITQPSAISTSTAITNVLCNGGSTGSATVTASGGIGAFTYLWSSAQTTSVITGLNAGIRTVTVTDANSCTRTNTVTITQPTAINTSTAITNVLCNGGSTGSATVTASGGAGSFTYLWSSAQTTSVITGLNAGIRTVTVTDANSCTRTNTVTITQPTAINTSTAITNVLCNGGSTGSATITASGGAGSFTYLWSSAQTTSVISGQTSGVRTVTVTDGNGCTGTNTVTISQPASALATSTAITNVLCFGNSTGAATVTASGGVGSFTYLWSSAQTTSVISGQTSGVRTVTVTDGNGCTATNTVTISQPASALATSTAITNVLCFGNSTGAATVTASGGTGPYSYLWSSAQTTSVISSLNSGIRTVTVTDANGCISVNTVNISQPASALSATQSQTNITCVNINGFGSVNVSGGTAGYNYNWTPTGGTSSASSALTAGNYTCTISDANMCSTTAVFTITANVVAPSVSITGTTQVCMGQSAFLTANGANTYSWSTTSTTNTVLVSPSVLTTYSVVGTNSVNGCVASAAHTVIVNAIPTVSVNSGSICNGNSFTITPSGASTYTIEGGNAIVSPTVNATYTVIGTSSAGCVSVSSATSSVTVNPNPIITGISNQTLCLGNSFTLSPNGASSYTVAQGVSMPASFSNSIVITPTAGLSVYTVTGTSSLSCNGSNTLSTIVNPNPIVTAVTSTSIICGPPFQGTATINASGASTYTWNTSATGSSITVTPSVTTSYTVTGTDANGCQNTAVITQSVDACTGINEFVSGNGVSVYPNPNNGIFTIYIQNVNSKTSITVTNVLGQTVLKRNVIEEKTLLNIQELENGIYFVNVTHNGVKQINKIIKQ
jgi:hypothetical protein